LRIPELSNIFLIPQPGGIMASLQEIVGGNIRGQRQILGLSQQALADRAGLSRRMVTLIEGGDGNASLATLDRLAAALNLTFARLTQAEDCSAQSKPMDLWQGKDKRSKARLLESCPARQEVELWSWSLAPGERYDAEPDPAGMHEMLTVISGTLDLVVVGKTQRLTSGQSASFPSNQPYAYVNSGTTLLRFIKNVVR
jgi:transcriptional regulator with XRE-family HTH domain